MENFKAFFDSQISEKNIPDFRAGDTVRLAVTIKEGDKTRVQQYEGVCIAMSGTGTGKTATVRKIGANSVGIERINVATYQAVSGTGKEAIEEGGRITRPRTGPVHALVTSPGVDLGQRGEQLPAWPITA